MTKGKTTEEVSKSAEEVKAEKTAVASKDEIVDKAKEILDKKCGKFSIKQILIAVLCVVVVLVVIKGVTNLFSSDSKVPDYQVVYTNDDGDLMVVSANGKKEVKLSNDGTGAMYANTTDRYILFGKNNDLYLYDKKHPEDSQKVGKDITDAGFSKDDKYVWYLNKDDELYSYKKESKKIDSDVEDVISVTDNGIFYTKSGDDGAEIYYRNLNGKKDKVKVTSDATEYYVAYDGKTVAYTDSDDEFHIFKLSNKKDTKVANDIVSIEDASKNLSSIYIKDEDSNVYLVKGTKSTKVVDEVKYIYEVDAEKEQLVYSDDDTIYYKKSTNKDAKIGDSEKVSNVEIRNGKELYYIYDGDELYYSKLSGSKATTPKSVLDDVDSIANLDFAGGLVVYTDVKDGVGTLNTVKGGKSQKVVDDVYASPYSAKVSLNKKKLYFLGEYDSKGSEGNLMSTTGKKAKTLVEDVKYFDYVKDNMIYVATNYSKKGKFDLGCYNGRKVVKIAENATGFERHPSKETPSATYGRGRGSSSSSSSYDYDDYDYDYDYDDDYDY